MNDESVDNGNATQNNVAEENLEENFELEVEIQPVMDPAIENPDWGILEGDIEYTDPQFVCRTILECHERKKDLVFSESEKARMDDPIEVPTYCPDYVGKFFMAEYNRTLNSTDSYQPWSTSKKVEVGVSRPRYATIQVPYNGEMYKLKVYRTAHWLSPNLLKEHIRVLELPELADILFISYIFRTPNMIMPPKKTTLRIDSRTSKKIKAALLQNGISDCVGASIPGVPFKVGRKQLQNLTRDMTEVEKEKCGPIPGPDIDRLFALSKRYPGLDFQTVGGESLEDASNKSIEAIYLSRAGCTLYLADVCDEATLQKHHDEIDQVMDLPADKHGAFIVAKHRGTTPSSTVVELSSFIQADTTFHMTDFYITTIVGVVERFRTVGSLKCRPIILGFITHTTKEMYHHITLGDRLAAMFKSIDATKKVPAYITDGEQALKRLFDGRPAFSMATQLRCDIHVRRNIVRDLQRVITPKELKRLCGRLFGVTGKKKLIGTKLIGGVLSNVTEREYKKAMKKLKKHFHNNKHINNALDSRTKWLWKNNSMYYKMRAGIITKWVSTNVIECINNKMQQMFPRPEGIHSTVERLIKLCEADMLELWKAMVSDKTSNAVVSTTFARFKQTEAGWMTMPSSMKVKWLKFFGLPTELAEKDSAMPMWLRKECPLYDDFIKKCSVYHVSNTYRYVLYKRGVWSGGMCIEGNDTEFTCCEDACEKRKKRKTEPCCHIAAIIASLHRDVARRYWLFYEVNRDSRTGKQLHLVERKPRQGMKRDGTYRSKHNRKREINDVVLNNSDYFSNASGMSNLFEEEESSEEESSEEESSDSEQSISDDQQNDVSDEEVSNESEHDSSLSEDGSDESEDDDSDDSEGGDSDKSEIDDFYTGPEPLQQSSAEPDFFGGMSDINNIGGYDGMADMDDNGNYVSNDSKMLSLADDISLPFNTMDDSSVMVVDGEKEKKKKKKRKRKSTSEVPAVIIKKRKIKAERVVECSSQFVEEKPSVSVNPRKNADKKLKVSNDYQDSEDRRGGSVKSRKTPRKKLNVSNVSQDSEDRTRGSVKPRKISGKKQKIVNTSLASEYEPSGALKATDHTPSGSRKPRKTAGKKLKVSNVSQDSEDRTGGSVKPRKISGKKQKILNTSLASEYEPSGARKTDDKKLKVSNARQATDHKPSGSLKPRKTDKKPNVSNVRQDNKNPTGKMKSAGRKPLPYVPSVGSRTSTRNRSSVIPFSPCNDPAYM